MLLRNKKKNDLNEGKWIGIGGKIEPGETIEHCLIREVFEETGITLSSFQYRGVVDFVSDIAPEEIMHLFTAQIPVKPEVISCSEGTLKWIPISEVPGLNLWEGDRVFLQLLVDNSQFFNLTLKYSGYDLVSSELLFPET